METTKQYYDKLVADEKIISEEFCREYRIWESLDILAENSKGEEGKKFLKEVCDDPDIYEADFEEVKKQQWDRVLFAQRRHFALLSQISLVEIELQEEAVQTTSVN